MKLMLNLMKRSPGKTANLMKCETVSSIRNVEAIDVMKSGIAKAKIGMIEEKARVSGKNEMIEMSRIVVKQRKSHGGSFGNRVMNIY